MVAVLQRRLAEISVLVDELAFQRASQAPA